MVKRIAAAAVAVAVTGLAWYLADDPTNSRPAAFSGCADEGVETLEIEVTPSKRTYLVGQKTRFDVAVFRVAQPDERMRPRKVTPADGAKVTLGLFLGGDRVSTAYGVTDDEGHAKLKTRLPLTLAPGEMDLMAYATRDATDLSCSPYEEGHFETRRAIKARSRD